MAGLNIAASAPGWESTIRSLKAMPREVKTQVTKRGRTLAEPLAKEIRTAGHAQGGHAARVADRVRSGMKGGVPSVTATGLPYVMGSEYGGGIKRTTYYSTSPLGRRYLVVGRHTTRQFKSFRRDGYWWNDTINEGRGRGAVLSAWADLIDDVLRDF